MSGYTKLFSDIVESSIWREPPEICKVWITLLALCDQDGYVRGSVGWLAGKAQVGRESCAAAIALFQAPDHQSRTEDNEGRRIEAMPDGWLILNYLAFRDRLSNDPQACATRERVRKHRERYKALRNAESVTPAVSASVSVSVSSSGKEGSGEKTAGRPARDQAKAYAAEIRFAGWESWFDHFEANGWKVGGKAPMKDWKAAMRNGKRMNGGTSEGHRNPAKLTNTWQSENPHPEMTEAF